MKHRISFILLICIATHLNNRGFAIPERERLEQMAKENGLSLIRVFDHDTAVGFGRFLIPFDEDLEEPTTTLINMDKFETMSKRLQAKHVLFVLDSCYIGIAGVFQPCRYKIPDTILKEVTSILLHREYLFTSPLSLDNYL